MIIFGEFYSSHLKYIWTVFIKYNDKLSSKEIFYISVPCLYFWEW